MNRTFLIFLMIGSAMLIAVIGTQKPTIQHDYAPWDVTSSEQGALHVFGITLGKTTIKQASQVFGNSAETQFLVAPSDSKNHQRQLITIYKDLIISGVISELRLTHQLDKHKLNELYSILSTESNAQDTQQSYIIPAELKAQYLSTPIASITYIPSINYGEDVILQRFGTPSEELAKSDTITLWLYPEIGLEIQLRPNQAEHFIYTDLKSITQ